MRLAARPVGAHSWMRNFLAARICRMALIKVVLPTPGPPVITSTLLARACSTAAFWLAASSRPRRCSTQVIALLASMAPQVGAPCASSCSDSAMRRSSRCRWARKIAGSDARASATTEHSLSSRSRAVWIRAASRGTRTLAPLPSPCFPAGCSTASSSPASLSSSAVGRPQCPSPLASSRA